MLYRVTGNELQIGIGADGSKKKKKKRKEGRQGVELNVPYTFPGFDS